MLDAILKLFFIACLIVLAFLAGFGAKFFDAGFTQQLDNALTAYEAMQKQKEEIAPALSDKNDIDSLLAKKKVSWDKGFTSDGYTLITLRYSSTAYLLDMEGNVVYRWSAPFSKIWKNPSHIQKPINDKWIYMEKAHVFPNGDLLVIYTGWGDTPYGYGMAKLDKDSNLIWKYDNRVHHDFDVAPISGTITTLIHEVVTSSENLYNSDSRRMTLDSLVVLSAQGEELKRVSIPDALANSSYSLLLNHYQKNLAAWDRFHTNSVDVLSADLAGKFPQFPEGSVLISLRNLNALAVIDLEKRQVIWAYNGLWRAQHSAHYLDNGNILLFDNKGHAVGKRIFSRLIEINPSTLAVNWSYTGSRENPFYTDFYGRVQRLENGNSLVVESLSSRLFEVTPDKKIVWEYKIPQIILNEAKKALYTPKPITCIPPYMEEPHMFDSTISGFIVSALRYPKDSLHFLK